MIVDGQDAEHRSRVQLDAVRVDDPARYTFFAKDAVLTYGPGAVNFRFKGEDVTGSESTAKANSAEVQNKTCVDRFVPFPR